jgi:hypothetical protein
MNTLETYTLPTSYAIKRLRESDFALDTRDKICLYEDFCSLVLFYNESNESKRILSVFKTVAESISGPTFAACNILLEKKIAESFVELFNIKDHPFSWTSERPFPFILVYRRGYPVMFYDGPADVQILTNFSLNIACNPIYHSRNFPLLKKLKDEMWVDYKLKNPIVIGGPMSAKEVTPYILPALPYNRN